MKRVLITRPRAQADDLAQMLRVAGFEPIFFPVIEIQRVENNDALERALSRLECYDWVIFTSANAVNLVFDRYPSHLSASRKRVKFAVVGPKTAEALRAHACTPAFVPDNYIPESILPGLGDLRGKWVLLPRAELAQSALPEAILKAGGIPHEITVYRTLPVSADPEGLLALRSGVDTITLTSASTVRNFVSVVRQNGLDPLSLPGRPVFACIGPTTEQAARTAGLAPLVTAREHTSRGLVETIGNL